MVAATHVNFPCEKFEGKTFSFLLLLLKEAKFVNNEVSYNFSSHFNLVIVQPQKILLWKSYFKDYKNAFDGFYKPLNSGGHQTPLGYFYDILGT